jgi:hypothetical protein
MDKATSWGRRRNLLVLTARTIEQLRADAQFLSAMVPCKLYAVQRGLLARRAKRLLSLS